MQKKKKKKKKEKKKKLCFDLVQPKVPLEKPHLSVLEVDDMGPIDSWFDLQSSVTSTNYKFWKMSVELYISWHFNINYSLKNV